MNRKVLNAGFEGWIDSRKLLLVLDIALGWPLVFSAEPYFLHAVLAILLV